jgi:hypothetical protein
MSDEPTLADAIQALRDEVARVEATQGALDKFYGPARKFGAGGRRTQACFEKAIAALEFVEAHREEFLALVKAKRGRSKDSRGAATG